MKVTTSLFIVLFLLMHLSLKAQNHNCKESITITEIKDSIVNKNYSYKYILPKVVSKGELRLEKLNNTIARMAFSGFLSENNKEINDSLTGIEGYFDKQIERLNDLEAKGLVIQHNTKLSYSTKFNDKGLLSFKFLTRETQTTNEERRVSYLSLDSKTGKEVLFDDIIVDTLSLPLLSKIEISFYKQVKKEIDDFTISVGRKDTIRSFLIVNNEDNFPLQKSPKGYFCKNDKGKSGMCFIIESASPKLFQSLEWFVKGCFFSFEELEPYLTEDFKIRIGLE
ncbi:hypothetical protein BZG01_21045 [Labilibaculum manganireducens]|uniref:DUF3298 domain-containing protein n=1 Tax=Labilibaculum manganireducens TaxID=1940525 RepID=A0A2N3HQR5_9BACT|nr:hypothetical protein [Labilibaculum manganireducens]PKQ60401.1 hypothetical protein BZG01_21045 [Labilibaculum manganireducens]